LNYRHAYHAGNFADVLKHAALIAIVFHLRKKEKSFAVIDTHAGRGIYDIGGSEAKKTGEAAGGILRLLSLESLPGVLTSYCDLVRGFGEGVYPGSPLIAANLLRGKDRLIAVEKHPEEYEALAAALAGEKGAHAIKGDGYSELPRLVPPPERRGLVVIDPPYEAEDEFPRATRAIVEAHRRFATGIFLFWYPAKILPAVAASVGEFFNAGISSLLKIEFDTGAPKAPKEPGRGEPMTSTGILVVNPPFGFADEMKAILPFLAHALAQGANAHGEIEILAHR
jgi:23S rRNA (adenine2030-N6)-methyltransferase